MAAAAVWGPFSPPTPSLASNASQRELSHLLPAPSLEMPAGRLLPRRPPPPSPLKREPEGVSHAVSLPSPETRAGGLTSRPHPLPRLKREPEGVPYDVAIPSPETRVGGLLAAHPLAPQTRAGLLLAAHPFPRLKRGPEVLFYFTTIVFVFTIIVMYSSTTYSALAQVA